jgi:hypothetical protein
MFTCNNKPIDHKAIHMDKEESSDTTKIKDPIFYDSEIAYFEYYSKIKEDKDTSAYRLLIKLSILKGYDFMGPSYLMSKQIDYPFANYYLFRRFTSNKLENTYSIEDLSYIDKCFALDKLYKSVLKGQAEAIKVVNYYQKLKLDYFIVKGAKIELNSKYIPTEK